MNLAKKINLKDDERIVSILRPYILTYAWKYFFGLAFLLLSSFFMFRLFFYGWWGDIIYGIGILVGFYLILQALCINRANILVVSNARIVDIHRVGWFDEIISSAGYMEIKDVAVRKKGIWQSLFNYGGLAIQTKAQNFILEILGINNPTQIQGLILDLSQQYKQDIKVANSQVIYNNFIKILPNLPDGDLHTVQTLISEQLNPNLESVDGK
jgi:hypothetical protein